MHRLSALTEFYVGHNKLGRLPNNFTILNLTMFHAENNLLTTIPMSIAKCRNLTRINLEENPIEASVWSLLSNLPKLIDLRMKSHVNLAL
jgi:Leucine-rich repeat (LRR) protein